MPTGYRLALLLVAAAFITAACAVAPTPAPPAEPPGPLPELVASFAERPTGGEVTVEQGSLESRYGCRIGYEYYQPHFGVTANVHAPSAPLVVLGHGFMRDLTTVRGWAEQWSARGVRTVVVDFCNSTLVNGRHDRNAEDLIAVVNHLEPGHAPIIYAGFSAGGLSALLAAASDTRTVAYMGLDPVDSGELAATVDRLRVPALYLYGEPASCNAQGNMVETMPPAARRVALRIPSATHCDFEDPSNRICEVLCGTTQSQQLALETGRTIRALANAWIEAYAGASAESQTVFHLATLQELVRMRRVEMVGGD